MSRLGYLETQGISYNSCLIAGKYFNTAQRDTKKGVNSKCSTIPSKLSLDSFQVQAVSNNLRILPMDKIDLWKFICLHIRYRHTREKIAKCDLCEESFIDTALLSSHVARVHTKTRHVCPVCGKSFGRVESFKGHVRRHDDIKNYACATCGEKFVYHNQLRAHRIKDHGADPGDPFICEECGKTLKTATTLKLHVMTHRGEKPHKCDTCDYRAVTKARLLQHKRRHTDERPFPCDQCEDSFKARRELESHVSKIHEAVRYTCPHCGKEYFAKYTLRAHMRRHTGEKRVKCDHCEESFFDRYALSRHVALAHTETKQDGQGNKVAEALGRKN
ncbi:zinc finger protein 525-like [Folsomia candida]|uniref:zinc finger protein 525-like n=1 Tax=Folsomia candida TaxID=158441 RepID=UPI001604F8B9|nr:zinc finger protein 525-like [Folsomia candida]